jgi:2-amino-4-hydroxy-6-hydroxymethyldihydropteridine diphosphokinase
MLVLLLNGGKNRKMAQVYISIGSNIEPLRYIRASLVDLEQHYGTLTLSFVYESEAVGFEGNNFYNLVAGFDTKMDVHTVARTLRMIENNNGRQHTNNRFSARTLDLDILLYDDLVLKDNTLEVPRNEILKYAFVLLPLSKIAPTLKHPITNQSYAALWQAFNKEEHSLWRVNI